MAGEWIWYELLTTDAAAAQRFYGEVVGWTFSDPEDHGYIHLTAGDGQQVGGMVQLTAEMQEHGARPVWLGYLNVDDVDAEVAAIERDGGAVKMPAMDIPHVGRIAMVADPQGAPFYVMRPTPPPDRPDAKSAAFAPMDAQHVRWNELMTDDPDAAIAFYRKHFGWAQEGDMDMGPMGKYRFIQKDGAGIGAVMKRPPEAPVSVWAYYVGVDDIDRAVEAIAGGGGRVVNGPMEIPGGEFALNGIDPQGAAFGLVGPRKA